MARSFLFEVPKTFSKVYVNELREKIHKIAFVEFFNYSDETHFEFLFEEDNWTEEKMRKVFELPSSIKIIDTSFWSH